MHEYIWFTFEVVFGGITGAAFAGIFAISTNLVIDKYFGNMTKNVDANRSFDVAINMAKNASVIGLVAGAMIVVLTKS